MEGVGGCLPRATAQPLWHEAGLNLHSFGTLNLKPDFDLELISWGGPLQLSTDRAIICTVGWGLRKGFSRRVNFVFTPRPQPEAPPGKEFMMHTSRKRAFKKINPA